jgi:hypothetical protein
MNFMEKVFTCLVLLALVMTGVFAVDDWEDVNNGSAEEGEIDSETLKEREGVSEVFENGEFYTTNFYIALILGLLALLIIGIFVFFWLRGPKNKWDK